MRSAVPREAHQRSPATSACRAQTATGFCASPELKWDEQQQEKLPSSQLDVSSSVECPQVCGVRTRDLSQVQGRELHGHPSFASRDQHRLAVQG